MGRHHDFSGMDTSLPSAEAVAAWDATMRAFLAHGAATPSHLAETLRLAPDFAQGFACKGLFCLLLGRAEMEETARAAAGEARAAAHRVAPLPREAVYLDALDDFLAGRPGAAADRLDALLVRAPRDALAMKLVQAIRFVLGQSVAMRRSVEALAPAYADHPALGYLKGCHAFTLEETGEYAAAETAGREGLLLARDDAWGLHAVAHVYDMTARPRDGLKWLSTRTEAWAHCNNFRFHVWWHKALMHLDLGEFDAALALYDSDVRAEKTDDYRDIANATSLLSRLEIEGVDVGSRWEELADLAAGRAQDGCLAFADLHYMLALIGGDRPAAAAELLARIARDAQANRSDMDQIYHHPGLSAAEGLEAFGEGRFGAAFTHLSGAQDALQRVGGSHAQRDIFERLTIEAALRGGYLSAAERLLGERLTRRGGARDGYTDRRLATLAEARTGARIGARTGTGAAAGRPALAEGA